MASVCTQPYQPQRAVVLEAQQSTEPVTEATKGIFARTKETIVRYWNAFVSGFYATSSTIAIVCFNTINFFSPTLGHYVETTALRLQNIWQSMQEAWRREEVEQEMDQLRFDKANLLTQVRDLRHHARDNQRLTARCTQLEGEKEHLLNQVQGAEERHQLMGEREQAAVRYSHLLEGQNQALTEENEQLKESLEEVEQSVQPLRDENESLKDRLEQALREVADMRVQMQPIQDLYSQISGVVEQCKTQVRVGHRTQLDGELDGIVPLLLTQIDQAKEMLTNSMTHMPESGKRATQSAIRILDEIHRSMTNIPQIFRVHTACRDEVGRLLEVPLQQGVY